jgi:type I restriction enzyme S subunit
MSRLDDLIAKLCPGGVEYKRFGDIATIVRGGSPRPIYNFITTDADGVNWIKIGDVNKGGKYITSTKERIIREGVSKSRYVKAGDFVLSNSMSFGRPYILKIDGCIHDGWLAISGFSDCFMPDFLYHLLSSDFIQKIMSQKASNGTVQNLNADIVKSIELPIPPLPVQQEIVRILDKFTALEAELEAELEARRKQYEYYRDKLLTFKLYEESDNNID